MLSRNSVMPCRNAVIKPLLGELVVVPFGDYAKALDAEYTRGREDERMKHHANSCCHICKTHVNPHRGCILR